MDSKDSCSIAMLLSCKHQVREIAQLSVWPWTLLRKDKPGSWPCRSFLRHLVVFNVLVATYQLFFTRVCFSGHVSVCGAALLVIE